MPKILSSPFGSQLVETQGPQGRDIITHLCSDGEYDADFLRIVRADRDAGASRPCLDLFGLRNEFASKTGGGVAVAREIVARQQHLIDSVYGEVGRRVPHLTASLHSKLIDCYSSTPPDPEEVEDLTVRQVELLGTDTDLLFETVASRLEAEHILIALKSVGRLEAAQLAFTLNDQFLLPSGEDPFDVIVDLARRFPQVGFGLNCFPPDFRRLQKLLNRLNRASVSLQIIYPNTHGFGGTIEANGVHGDAVSPQRFAQQLHSVSVPFNSNITLGACCGGHAAYVGAFHDHIHGARRNSVLLLAA